jgi:hypothetical protein
MIVQGMAQIGLAQDLVMIGLEEMVQDTAHASEVIEVQDQMINLAAIEAISVLMMSGHVRVGVSADEDICRL